MARTSIIPVVVGFTLFLSGCDSSLRFAPGEEQKQNAWLHNRTAVLAAQTAKAEQSSAQLQALTQLSESQSKAFTIDYGPPAQYPPAETAEDILAVSSWKLAEEAATESAQRPDPWVVADAVLELGLGLAGLFGGAFAVRLTQFLRDARAKAKALQEIVEGNEIFKKERPKETEAFKAAQGKQSVTTRQLVAKLKMTDRAK